MTNNDSSKRIALVTGAGSGIGRAAALVLLERGWTVVLAGRRMAALQETAAQSADPAKALPLAADVSRPEDVNALYARIDAEFGRLDLLFNNAGIFVPSVPVDELPVEHWRQSVDVNLTGAFLSAQGAFRLMKKQSPRGGRIINNGSISAHAPRPNSAPYTATKHAITGLTKSLSLDGRAFDIACGQLDIGNALTEMAQPMTKGVRQANGEIAIEPTMDVAHVASAVLYMAELPLSANVQFMTVMASAMPFVGRG
ncbi:SDR family oxidoreductase [Pelomonas sp. V22]|uniref:SDR family oxidoreductase n=1 Tax=Pelomonas sp. V22 TaxID=2822139 RepID=UPI0024A95697|nr:SDR family oxidoreductase [Pelomonas sp. V22]MDI4631908.1 SDR family oxidoreductase [Pelomonas sp. V22]